MVCRWFVAILLSVGVTACPFVCSFEQDCAAQGSGCACCCHEEGPSDAPSEPADNGKDPQGCDCFCKGAIVLRQNEAGELFDLLVCPLELAPGDLPVDSCRLPEGLERPAGPARPSINIGRSIRALISSLII
jgi:hypothetical protein